MAAAVEAMGFSAPGSDIAPGLSGAGIGLELEQVARLARKHIADRLQRRKPDRARLAGLRPKSRESERFHRAIAQHRRAAPVPPNMAPDIVGKIATTRRTAYQGG
jgi:hypothetical protein